MKRVNVAKLKAGLSHYLRLVQKGETVLVIDRKKPIAELVPLPSEETIWQRWERQGICRVGSQNFADIKIPRLKKSVPIERILREVSADPE